MWGAVHGKRINLVKQQAAGSFSKCFPHRLNTGAPVAEIVRFMKQGRGPESLLVQRDPATEKAQDGLGASGCGEQGNQLPCWYPSGVPVKVDAGRWQGVHRIASTHRPVLLAFCSSLSLIHDFQSSN